MAEREDPFVENAPDGSSVICSTNLDRFFKWFAETRPDQTIEQQFSWNGYWATYHPETNRISWEVYVPDKPEDRGVDKETQRIVNGDQLQMIPAIVLPEPKPFYGVDPIVWYNLDDDNRKEAKETYLESAAALRSIYADILAPIAVIK